MVSCDWVSHLIFVTFSVLLYSEIKCLCLTVSIQRDFAPLSHRYRSRPSIWNRAELTFSQQFLAGFTEKYDRLFFLILTQQDYFHGKAKPFDSACYSIFINFSNLVLPSISHLRKYEPRARAFMSISVVFETVLMVSPSNVTTDNFMSR
jgi:hypothetical protein